MGVSKGFEYSCPRDISVFVLWIFEKKCDVFIYDLKTNRPCSYNLLVLSAGQSRFRLQLQLIMMKHPVNRALQSLPKHPGVLACHNRGLQVELIILMMPLFYLDFTGSQTWSLHYIT